MRAAPPFAFTVSRFGVWRAALALLAVLGVAAMALWWGSADQPAPATQGLVAVAGVLAAVLPLAQSRRLSACMLRWDGQRWHLTEAQLMARPSGGDAVAGRLAVTIDLGNWLLLHFAAENPAKRPCPPMVWIPLQRSGLEREWHAIRSVLYSPQPGVAPAVRSAG